MANIETLDTVGKCTARGDAATVVRPVVRLTAVVREQQEWDREAALAWRLALLNGAGAWDYQANQAVNPGLRARYIDSIHEDGVPMEN